MLLMNNYLRTTRRFLFLATRDEARKWSRKNAAIAREALSLSNSMDTTEYSDMNARSKDLETFLRDRQWVGMKLNDTMDVQMITVLISQALTYPLTLGAFSHYFPSATQDIRLAIVGARAEATLPFYYWKEMLYMCNMVGSDRPNRDTIRWSLDFIGNEITNNKLPPRFISLQGLQKHTKLELNYYRASFHQHILDTSSTRSQECAPVDLWDGFVLFNPGLGHPNLTNSWKPTLDLIFSSNKPILVTAHSEIDQERDRQILLQYAHEFHRQSDINYILNPFASRMLFEDIVKVGDDDLDRTSHLVRPNYSICLL